VTGPARVHVTGKILIWDRRACSSTSGTPAPKGPSDGGEDHRSLGAHSEGDGTLLRFTHRRLTDRPRPSCGGMHGFLDRLENQLDVSAARGLGHSI